MYSTLKILRHPERLSEWMRLGHPVAPIGFDLHITNICPHKCPHCNGNKDGAAYGPSLSELKGILSTWAGRVKGVNFCGGGEPLAREQVVNILEYAKSLGYSVGLMTNLYKLPTEGALRLARACTWIRVTLDAGTPEWYMKRHGVDAGEYGMVLLRLAELTANKGDCTVGVGYLTDADTDIRDMQQAIREVQAAGADYIQFRPMNDSTATFENLLPYWAALHATDTIQVSYSKAKYAGIREYQECHGARFWTTITATGDMRLCCETRDPRAIVGNVLKEGVEALWQRVPQALASLDLANCPPTCHLSIYNTMLDGLAKPILHEAHL